MTEAHLSKLRSGKGRGVRLDTVLKLYLALDGRPGDLLELRK